MGIERRHYRRQRRFTKAMFRIVHAQPEAGLQRFIQRGDIGKIDLLHHVVILPVGKVEIGEGHFAAVRQMTAHQQMVTEVRLWPVRRPEVAHHIIRRILAA